MTESEEDGLLDAEGALVNPPTAPPSMVHLSQRVLNWLRHLSDDPFFWQAWFSAVRAVFFNGVHETTPDIDSILLLYSDVIQDVVGMVDVVGLDWKMMNLHFPMKGCKFTSSLVAACVCHQEHFRRIVAFNSRLYSSKPRSPAQIDAEIANQEETLNRRHDWCVSAAERNVRTGVSQPSLFAARAMVDGSLRGGDLTREMSHVEDSLAYTRRDPRNYRHPEFLASHEFLLRAFEENVTYLKESGELKEGVAILVRLHDLVAVSMKTVPHQQSNLSHHFTIFLAIDKEEEEEEGEGESDSVVKGFVAQSLSPYGCKRIPEIEAVDKWPELIEEETNTGRGYSIAYGMKHLTEILTEEGLRMWIRDFQSFCRAERFSCDLYRQLFHAELTSQGTARNFHVSVTCRVVEFSANSFEVWQEHYFEVKRLLSRCRLCRTNKLFPIDERRRELMNLKPTEYTITGESATTVLRKYQEQNGECTIEDLLQERSYLLGADFFHACDGCQEDPEWKSKLGETRGGIGANPDRPQFTIDQLGEMFRFMLASPVRFPIDAIEEATIESSRPRTTTKKKARRSRKRGGRQRGQRAGGRGRVKHTKAWKRKKRRKRRR